WSAPAAGPVAPSSTLRLALPNRLTVRRHRGRRKPGPECNFPDVARPLGSRSGGNRTLTPVLLLQPGGGGVELAVLAAPALEEGAQDGVGVAAEAFRVLLQPCRYPPALDEAPEGLGQALHLRLVAGADGGHFRHGGSGEPGIEHLVLGGQMELDQAGGFDDRLADVFCVGVDPGP